MPSVGGLTSTENLSGSSHGSSAELLLGVPGQDIPTMTTGLPPIYLRVCLLILVTAAPPTVTAHWTDLVLSPGEKTIKLTAQHRLVKLVIKESFKILHSLLLSTDAFPDGAMAIAFVKDALRRAALKYIPAAIPIGERIERDREYFCMILPLVSLTNVHDHST